jgi:hypothetical protein
MVREIHLSRNITNTHSTSGVGTISQFISGTNTVFGMGLDLAAFLSVYGAVMDGDLTSWSIGKSSMLSQTDQR